MNDVEREKKLNDKGLNAPRLNPDIINAAIRNAAFHVFPGTTLTVCCLTLTNGFNVVGQAAAASLENFDRQIGEDVARADAVRQVWALEGYLLKQRLHDAEA